MSAGKLWVFSPGALRSFGSFIYPLLLAVFSVCCHHTRGSELGFVFLTCIKGVYDSLTRYSQSIRPLSPSCYSSMLLVHIPP